MPYWRVAKNSDISDKFKIIVLLSWFELYHLKHIVHNCFYLLFLLFALSHPTMPFYYYTDKGRIISLTLLMSYYTYYVH